MARRRKSSTITDPRLTGDERLDGLLQFASMTGDTEARWELIERAWPAIYELWERAWRHQAPERGAPGPGALEIPVPGEGAVMTTDARRIEFDWWPTRELAERTAAVTRRDGNEPWTWPPTKPGALDTAWSLGSAKTSEEVAVIWIMTTCHELLEAGSVFRNENDGPVWRDLVRVTSYAAIRVAAERMINPAWHAHTRIVLPEHPLEDYPIATLLAEMRPTTFWHLIVLAHLNARLVLGDWTLVRFIPVEKHLRAVTDVQEEAKATSER